MCLSFRSLLPVKPSFSLVRPPDLHTHSSRVRPFLPSRVHDRSLSGIWTRQSHLHACGGGRKVDQGMDQGRERLGREKEQGRHREESSSQLPSLEENGALIQDVRPALLKQNRRTVLRQAAVEI